MADQKLTALTDITTNLSTDDILYVVNDPAGSPASRYVTVSAIGLFLSGKNYLQYRDEKAQNTAAGTFTSGAWQTRTLNTEVNDAEGLGTLATNQITLTAGTYRILASAPAWTVNRHQLRLQNITDATTLLIGQSFYSASGSEGLATLRGQFTVAASKALELQHRCETTKTSDGMGVAGNFTTEVYAIVELWRIS